MNIINETEFERELLKAISEVDDVYVDFAIAKFDRPINSIYRADKAEELMQGYIPEEVFNSEIIIELSDQEDLNENELEYRIYKK